MSRGILEATAFLLLSGLPSSLLADWSQWRGPNRDGSVHGSPKLVSTVPEEGIRALWTSDKIPSAWSGGWGSPIVHDGKVFTFVHSRSKTQNAKEPKRKFPWVKPEDRTDWSDERFEEYEKNRRDEDETIGKSVYSFRETLYCLDGSSGKTLWTHGTDSIYTRFLQSGTPAIVDGKLFVLAAAYTVRCFDVAGDKGREIWSRRLPGKFRDEFRMASILVVDGVAVVQAGRLFGLEVASGKILWEGDAKTTEGSHSSPVEWKSGDRSLFVVNVKGGRTICVEARSGDVLWELESSAGLSTPLVRGKRLYTFGSSRKSGLRCFEMSTQGAELVWKYQGLADKGSSPVIVGGNIFVQGERRLACVDAGTGEKRWSTTLRLRTPQFTSLVAADGKVFYTCEGLLGFEASAKGYRPLVEGKFGDGGLLASEESHRRRLKLDEIEKGEGGRKKAQKIWAEKVGKHGPLECASPAFLDGRIIVRLKEGFGCYDLRARPQQ